MMCSGIINPESLMVRYPVPCTVASPSGEVQYRIGDTRTRTWIRDRFSAIPAKLLATIFRVTGCILSRALRVIFVILGTVRIREQTGRVFS